MPYQRRGPIPSGDTTAIERELDAVAQAAFDPVDVLRLTILNKSPEKTRAGMVVYADGANWNPGSGEGVYRRNKANSAWVYLG